MTSCHPSSPRARQGLEDTLRQPEKSWAFPSACHENCLSVGDATHAAFPSHPHLLRRVGEATRKIPDQSLRRFVVAISDPPPNPDGEMPPRIPLIKFPKRNLKAPSPPAAQPADQHATLMSRLGKRRKHS
ncbi:hypothetical protein GUJ93_ZPchr0006g44772 [Zizania palustris]|uniref:Uncharacterized protein n=1 Tax=Zizania palustris TaxID=103762 RepID=A0A8J5VL35_ZIZPA|nr:hypothetical protein GUJ93_ZPchr0006g44772 [Zizania palustris]